MKLVFIRLTIGAMALASVGLVAPACFGQQTSTGAFGTRTVGGAGSAATPRSGSTTGSGGQASMMQQASGAVSGTERYVRGNRQGQFVGAGSEDVRATGVTQADGAGGSRNGQMSMFGQGSNNVLGQLLQGQFNEQNRTQQGGRTNRPQIRVPIRLGFTAKPAPPAKFTAQFQTRLGRLPALTAVGPIEVRLEGETVVLRGAVASEGDRQLAEDVALLEPGVSTVRNELKVQLADTSGEALPAPTPANP